ncbi:thioesterase family protein [Aeromicrobium duanguangcaii]|uniref:Thioesterase family protein n=1 Tax=Aeromicrobium duanguangcaii TaxID=2968086 RepID=A0ABY5KGU5_9ACTN|nr:thioesterase family protein [Aeromicrobium duanguangcaii]MCD9153860.1 thioesterase family protein [Aeromicrobium duanguangcaii]UUI69060.1 thioesterase family protein [Aeromicrobium duanguangcaii]
MRTDMQGFEGCYRRIDRQQDAQDHVSEVFVPSAAAIGPWSDELQHGGPVGALLTRSMRQLPHGAPGRIARTTVEILGPIAMAPIEVTARVVRPGRKIELLSAVAHQVSESGTRPVAQATAWWLRSDESVEVMHSPEPALAPPTDEELERGELGVPASWRRGFVGSLRWAVRTPIGRIDGPAIAWASMPYPLVEGEIGDDLERCVAIADAANGVGSRLNPRDWVFMNTELTVHLAQPPVGEWTGMVAESWIGGDAVGMSSAVLSDLTGPVGRVAQSLLLERL